MFVKLISFMLYGFKGVKYDSVIDLNVTILNVISKFHTISVGFVC